MFRFSYEDRAWTAGQIIRDIRARLLSPAEHARADAMSEAAQAEQVAGLLRATRHLLILDNTESITAAPAAIPHALDPGEQTAQEPCWPGCAAAGPWSCSAPAKPSPGWPRAPPGLPAAGPGPAGRLVLVDRILRRHPPPPTSKTKRSGTRCRTWSPCWAGTRCR